MKQLVTDVISEKKRPSAIVQYKIQRKMKKIRNYCTRHKEKLKQIAMFNKNTTTNAKPHMYETF